QFVAIADRAVPGQLPATGRRNPAGVQTAGAGQRHGAGVDAEARTPPPGLAHGAGVHLRQRDRDQLLVVLLAQALKSVRIDRDEIPFPETLGEQPTGEHVVVAETVTFEIGVVAGDLQIEATAPVVGQAKAAFALDRAAEGVAARLRIALLLDWLAAVGPACVELELAALQEMAILDGEHRVLLRVEDR